MATSLSDSLTYFYGNAGLANAAVATAGVTIQDRIVTTIPSATTNVLAPLNMGTNVADIQFYLIQAFGTTLTVAFNATTGPTFNVTPNYPMAWVNGVPNASAVTQAVTNGIYLTNPGITTGTIDIRFSK